MNLINCEYAQVLTSITSANKVASGIEKRSRNWIILELPEMEADSMIRMGTCVPP